MFTVHLQVRDSFQCTDCERHSSPTRRVELVCFNVYEQTVPHIIESVSCWPLLMVERLVVVVITSFLCSSSLVPNILSASQILLLLFLVISYTQFLPNETVQCVCLALYDVNHSM